MRTYVYALVVALLSAGVYANSLGNGFVWDDAVEIVGDRLDTHNLDRLPGAFSISGMKGIYRPLRLAYLILMYRFCGVRPLPYHAVSIVLHATVTLLVFLVGRRMVGKEAALLGALVFAVHPVHAEAVAWVSVHYYPLSAAFLLGALLVHQIRTGRDAASWGSPPPARRNGIGPAVIEGLLLVCSLMAVECGIAFIFIIPAYYWFATGDRRELRGWASACAPALAAVTVYGIMRLAAVGAGGREIPLPGGIPGLLKADVIASAIYARILTIGSGLNVDHGWPIDTPLLSVKWLGSAAVCTAILVLGIILCRRTRAGAFLYWSTILSFIPVSNIIPTGATPISDRYAYIPSIFSCILIGLAVTTGVRYLGERYGARRAKIGAAVVLGSVFLSWIAATKERTSLWGNPAALWRDTVAKNPASVIGNYNLGLAYDDAGRLEEAAELYRLTIGLKPDHSLAYNNLGLIALRTGREAEALEHFRAAAAADTANAAARFNLGVLLSERGEVEEGLPHIEEAARLKPGNPVIAKKLDEIRGKPRPGY